MVLPLGFKPLPDCQVTHTFFLAGSQTRVILSESLQIPPWRILQALLASRRAVSDTADTDSSTHRFKIIPIRIPIRSVHIISRGKNKIGERDKAGKIKITHTEAK